MAVQVISREGHEALPCQSKSEHTSNRDSLQSQFCMQRCSSFSVLLACYDVTCVRRILGDYCAILKGLVLILQSLSQSIRPTSCGSCCHSQLQ